MKFIEIAKLILSLLPVLIQAIKAAEEAIPGEGKGEAKLALIRAVLEAAHGTASDSIGQFAVIWPTIQKTIGTVVATLNSLKAWGKPDDAAK